MMTLHENQDLFEEILFAASHDVKDGGLGVKRMFLEKDYWVTRSLRMLAESRFAEQDVVRNTSQMARSSSTSEATGSSGQGAWRGLQDTEEYR